MTKNALMIGVGLLLMSMLCSCTHYSTDLSQVDTTNLSQLEQLYGGGPLKSPFKQNGVTIRLRALKETAMSMGAQGGLSFAAERINNRLHEDTSLLETTYNFNGMMLPHGVLPPVLQESENNLNLADSTTIRIADKTYKILKQARFATTPPNWREYLILSYERPEIPDRTLLPATAEEQKIWKRSVRLGWEKGIGQASTNFQQNLARLKVDFQGMVLYRKLLQKRMINAPFVSRTELGVTGNGEDMRVNDQVLRITDLPQLQTNSTNWKPILVKPR